MSHTPGPWTLDDDAHGCVISDEYHVIDAGAGHSGDGFSLTGFMTEDDARLIAMAPEMLATLKRVWEWADNRADIKDNGEANDALIVKDMIEDELGGRP